MPLEGAVRLLFGCVRASLVIIRMNVLQSAASKPKSPGGPRRNEQVIRMKLTHSLFLMKTCFSNNRSKSIFSGWWQVCTLSVHMSFLTTTLSSYHLPCPPPPPPPPVEFCPLASLSAPDVALSEASPLLVCLPTAPSMMPALWSPS